VDDPHKIIEGERVLFIPGPGETMTAKINHSDQELLSDIELLTIQQIAKWARANPKYIYP
jgi:hypothetical protein